MSKRKSAQRRSHKVNPQTVAAAVAAPRLQEVLGQIGDPSRLAELVHRVFEEADAPLNQYYRDYTARFLGENDECLHLFRVVSEIENFAALEEGIRLGGFVVGFMTATRLITGQGLHHLEARPGSEVAR